MTEREKIAQLLCKQTGSNENRECETCPFNGCIAQRQADALIEAGYGNVAEWKRRAEVAERALNYAVSEYRCDECSCIECNAEIRGSQECVNLIAKTYKKQAEREIKEKRNESNKR